MDNALKGQDEVKLPDGTHIGDPDAGNGTKPAAPPAPPTCDCPCRSSAPGGTVDRATQPGDGGPATGGDAQPAVTGGNNGRATAAVTVAVAAAALPPPPPHREADRPDGPAAG